MLHACITTQLLVCFQCLEQVLLFTASPSLPADSASPDSNKSSAMHYTSVGLKLVATILSSHMRCIYSCLQTTQPMRLVASCLKLLTAMVLQGPSTARDIQQSFNFGYKPLQLLPSRTHQLQVCENWLLVMCLCVNGFTTELVLIKFLCSSGKC